jgi:hypothetical protein
MNAAEIVVENALADWWDNQSMPQDRWYVIENCGISEPRCMHLALRRWENLPLDLQRLVVNYGRSGRVLEFLP